MVAVGKKEKLKKVRIQSGNIAQRTNPIHKDYMYRQSILNSQGRKVDSSEYLGTNEQPYSSLKDIISPQFGDQQTNG